MTTIALPSRSALDRYPAQVAEVMARLQGGKSKHKGVTDPHQIYWELVYTVAFPFPSVPGTDTSEHWVEGLVAGTTTHLQGRIGSWKGASKTQIVGCPEEVVRMHRMNVGDLHERLAKILG